MNNKVLRIDQRDNVVVALADIPANTTIELDGQSYLIPQLIKAKHKFVTHDLQINDTVTMYGITVGKATAPIKCGEQITTTNLKHLTNGYSVEKRNKVTPQINLDISRWQDRTFMGYHRADGKVGTANYWLVLPLVFCENHNIQKLQKVFDQSLGYAKVDLYQQQLNDIVQLYQDGMIEQISQHQQMESSNTNPIAHQLFKNIDGLKFINHTLGCGGSNQDSASLARLFAAMVNNPNVAGVTVLSLGCQKTQFKDLMHEIKHINENFAKPILFFEQQEYGTEYKMLSAAIKETFLQLIEINKITRQPAPISKLCIGLKCGGSDGFSGISANPTLGVLSDILTAIGGSTILAEFPELCGVEQELINRCVNDEIAYRFANLMESYSAKAVAVGSGFDMNPSVGNIKDGLITDAIKSAGAAKKGGTSKIVDVLNYTEIVRKAGLNLLCTPGNDVIATTAMAASGANIILFTTGLGTPTGNPICPVVKVSTNTELFKKMTDAIDFDCGGIIKGNQTLLQAAEGLLEFCIELASGKFKTKAQLLGQDDFIPWQQGINL